MSYAKHNYQSLDKLYAAQLNEMDDQIASNEQGVTEAKESLQKLETGAEGTITGQLSESMTEITTEVNRLDYVDIKGIRNEIGITHEWNPDDIIKEYTGGNWVFVREVVDTEVLKAGDVITLVISEMKLSPITQGIRLTDGKLENYQSTKYYTEGIHVITLAMDGLGIHMQISNVDIPPSDTYYVKGIRVYKGDISKYHPQITADEAKTIADEAKTIADEVKANEGYIVNEDKTEITIQYENRPLISNGWVGAEDTTEKISTSSAINIEGYTHIKFDRDITVRHSNYMSLGFFISNKLGDTSVISFVHEYKKNEEYEIPVDAKFIRVCCHASDMPVLTKILKKSIADALDEKEDKKPVISDTYITEKGNLNIGDKLDLGLNNVKANKHLVFCANVGVMGKIRIGHGYHNYGATFLEIDSTEIKVVDYTTVETTKATWIHGLSISSDLQVLIDVETSNDMKATIRICSGGEWYENTVEKWGGSSGNIFVESVSATLTDCIASWTCDGYKKDIQLYGDSYFGITTSARWIYYLVKDGYGTNHLIDGFAGRNSASALLSFKNNISHSSPKYAVWCMGMNDNDNLDLINSSYKTATDEFLSICDARGITPILATIPSSKGGAVDDTAISTMRINKWKNAYVRNSGRRYIDFDKAVGADENTGLWYSGMLSSDGVHPTDKGAKALYLRAIVDAPELMMRN